MTQFFLKYKVEYDKNRQGNLAGKKPKIERSIRGIISVAPNMVLLSTLSDLRFAYLPNAYFGEPFLSGRPLDYLVVGDLGCSSFRNIHMGREACHYSETVIIKPEHFSQRFLDYNSELIGNCYKGIVPDVKSGHAFVKQMLERIIELSQRGLANSSTWLGVKEDIEGIWQANSGVTLKPKSIRPFRDLYFHIRLQLGKSLKAFRNGRNQNEALRICGWASDDEDTQLCRSSGLFKASGVQESSGKRERSLFRTKPIHSIDNVGLEPTTYMLLLERGTLVLPEANQRNLVWISSRDRVIIPIDTFLSSHNLKVASFPRVEYVESKAFKGCSNLEVAILSMDGLNFSSFTRDHFAINQFCGRDVFEGCNKLKYIVMPAPFSEYYTFLGIASAVVMIMPEIFDERLLAMSSDLIAAIYGNQELLSRCFESNGDIEGNLLKNRVKNTIFQSIVSNDSIPSEWPKPFHDLFEHVKQQLALGDFESEHLLYGKDGADDDSLVRRRVVKRKLTLNESEAEQALDSGEEPNSFSSPKREIKSSDYKRRRIEGLCRSLSVEGRARRSSAFIRVIPTQVNPEIALSESAQDSAERATKSL